MSDYGSRLASAHGDPDALIALVVELVEEVTRLTAEAAILQRRRAKDAARKNPRKSMELLGNPRHSTESAETPPPLPSSSFPEPHITPSFPPSPLPLHQPQGDEEARLAERAPKSWPTIGTFLVSREPVARVAWVGRFHGAFDRPPHPTDEEFADALGDLMTRPESDWVPPMFRRFVERIRRDSTRVIERTNMPLASRGGATADDETAWEQAQDVVGKLNRREIDAEGYANLPLRIRAGLSRVGGWTAIRDAKVTDLPWRKKDFLAGYHDTPATVSA